MAKQKAFEKKAKSYKLDLGELSVFTSQLASLLQAVRAAATASDSSRTCGLAASALKGVAMEFTNDLRDFGKGRWRWAPD